MNSATVGYGDVTVKSLLAAADNLRTFTEQTGNENHLSGMREALSSAERIVFLGFSYLPQNMELLTRDVEGNASQVLGTSFGLSEPDQELVSHQLATFFPEQRRSYKAASLSPIKCADWDAYFTVGDERWGVIATGGGGIAVVPG